MTKNLITFFLLLLILLWQFSFYNFFTNFLPIVLLFSLLLLFYGYQRGAVTLLIASVISFEYFSAHFYGYYALIFITYYFVISFLLRRFLINRSRLSLAVALAFSEIFYWLYNRFFLWLENLIWQKKYYYPFDYYLLIEDFIINLFILMIFYQIIKFLKNKFWSSNEIISA
jgi:hypothetical protein